MKYYEHTAQAIMKTCEVQQHSAHVFQSDVSETKLSAFVGFSLHKKKKCWQRELKGISLHKVVKKHACNHTARITTATGRGMMLDYPEWPQQLFRGFCLSNLFGPLGSLEFGSIYRRFCISYRYKY